MPSSYPITGSLDAFRWLPSDQSPPSDDDFYGLQICYVSTIDVKDSVLSYSSNVEDEVVIIQSYNTNNNDTHRCDSFNVNITRIDFDNKTMYQIIAGNAIYTQITSLESEMGHGVGDVIYIYVYILMYEHT